MQVVAEVEQVTSGLLTLLVVRGAAVQVAALRAPLER
jgi:hypothetical protein